LNISKELKTTNNLDRPFSLCGRRCYLIGLQNGLFPDYGWHTDGEMGGVWVHPIKIADGFWIGIETRDESHQGYYHSMRRWLKDCDEFILGDGGAWIKHHYNLTDFLVSRHEFVPYEEPAVGININISSKNKSLKKIQLNFLVRFDIQPVWFSGWPDPTSLEVEVKKERVIAHAVSKYVVSRNSGLWTAALGSNIKPGSVAIGDNLWGPEKTSGNGSSVLLKYPLTLNPDAHIRLVLAGDCEGEANALKTVDRVLRGYDRSLQSKIDHYSYVANDLTTVKTPEKLLNDAFLWSKLNLEWLTQTSPYVGTGVVAGHQDFPWYFGGDIELSILGLLSAGLHETAKNSLKLLATFGRIQKGRIPHEIVTNKVVYSQGHIMETTLFVRSVWDTYLWTGDEHFLKEMYPLCCMAIFDYSLKQLSKDDVLLLEYKDMPDSPRGKLSPSHVVAGLEALSKIAERIGDNITSEKAIVEARKMRRQIEDLFWYDAHGLYVSALDENNKPLVCSEYGWPGGTFSEPLSIAYWAVGEKSRVVKALSKIESKDYSSDWGVYLRPERNISMPITTGIAAIGEFNYDRLEQGLRFLRMIARSVGHIMPGAAPEYIHPSGDPKKYPPSSCYLQLWSAATYVQGLVWGLLHIQPDIAHNRVVMKPKLPNSWLYTEFKNVILGKSKIDVKIKKEKIEVNQVAGPKLEVTLL
jgi:glycogen debranching enzyme